MKTVAILACFVALAWAGSVPPHHEYELETRSVDAEFALRNKKILELFEYINQVDKEAEYYKIGKDYDIRANIEKYSNKPAVEEFLFMYKQGFLPKKAVFTVFKEQMLEEAIALFKLFYYAKDFDTFYKTAAFARVHFNSAQFAYSFYIATLHREDTKDFVLPAPYEVFPTFYLNSDVVSKMFRWKMQNSTTDFEDYYYYNQGLYKEQNDFVFYANYSDYFSYSHGEEKLAYFTEDIGLNSYYYFFNLYNPFWMKGEHFGALKEYRGSYYYYTLQRLLARYYLERLSNGLGEIPDFSWEKPIKYGYTSYLYKTGPFFQRPDFYQIPYARYEDQQFVESYEQSFLQYLEQGHFKSYGQEVDMHNSAALNFVGNFWHGNVDLYEKVQPRNYIRSYNAVARQLLSGAPEFEDKYQFWPSALSFYQTSMRDPMFYQMYSRILNYFLKYKEHLEPYTQDNLHFVGVKITDVQVDKLVTFFDYFDYDASNSIYYTPEELKSDDYYTYKVRQPRLDHKHFNVKIELKSDVNQEALFKIFLGPKYDSAGYPIDLENNWMNFMELDRFTYTLTQGQNEIIRKSDNFTLYQDDFTTYSKLYKLLEEQKVPKDMSEDYENLPNRLMLPRGTKGGYPFQFFVVVYPYVQPGAEFDNYRYLALDKKPLGYPFDRPVKSSYIFKQPNMYFKDVFIYHEGEMFPYIYNNPEYIRQLNQVPH